ncbi:MAG: S41 family peptidase [Planctomycetota bacterium]
MNRLTIRLCALALAWSVVLSQGLAAEPPAPANMTGAVVAAFLKPLAKVKAGDRAVWDCAGKLKAMGKEALPAIRNAASGEQPAAAKLALGWALLSLQDFAPGMKVLAAVIEGNAGRDAKLQAARVLGRLGQDAAEVEVTRLLDAAKDEFVTVELAQALSICATTEAAEAKATTVLVRLVRAGEGEVRFAAAVALAELDDFRKPVPAVLKELAAEPTVRGRLATKLLEMKRLSDLMIRETEYAGSLGNPLLDEIKKLIIEYHIEPPPKEEALVDAAARGMAALLHETDPFSSYMSPERWGEFREQMSGTYGGIGAHVMFVKDDRTGEEVFAAVKLVYTGPAYKAGLRAYDQFIEIDGEDIKGKKASEIRDMLRGLPDSVVACKIRRRGLKKDEYLLLKIIRARVTLPSVYSELMPGGIGYLRLTGFGDTSTAEVEKALRAMEEGGGMKALIFDLRDNPGGLMLAARDIADKFLKDDKLIVYSEGRNKKIAPRKEMRTTDPATHPDLPMVVLINGGSASASEIVAGALQDHKRAILIGERTYGKGSVQRLMRLDGTGRRSILKLTVARYFLPSGRSIHRTAKTRGGILPDITCALEASWPREAFDKHQAASDFYAYSRARWPKHKEKLVKLAEFDDRDASQYPGFDEWYDGLKVKIDKDSARRLLRQWIRLLAADDVGRDWTSDLQEDGQLQRAVYEVGKKIPKLDLKSVPEYKWFVAELERAGAPAANAK